MGVQRPSRQILGVLLPRVKVLDGKDNSLLNFLINCRTVFHAAAGFYIPPTEHVSSNFFTSSPTPCHFLGFVYFCLVIVTLIGVKLYLLSFGLHFSND